MMRGLATVSFFAHDLDAARAWYSELFEAEPYYVVPGGYLEWRLGDDGDEFGIVQAAWAPHPVADPAASGPAGAIGSGGSGSVAGGGVIVYWHVDDVRQAYERLRALGAAPHAAPHDRGQGFITSSVVDPFGNVLGIMENPHYARVVAARA